MQIRMILQIAIGFILLGFGTVGLVLPVLPTTPFVIGAFACFAGTPKLREKIMKIPFFNAHIKNYRNRIGLSTKNVALSLVFLWGMLVISFFSASSIWLKALLIAIGIAVTIHILFIAKPKYTRNASCNKEADHER